MKTILHALHVHAPPDAVFDALATEEGLAGWWSTRVEAEPRVGGHVDFTFFGDFNPYGNYNFNWGWYLASLKRLCETGQGNPFSPPNGASEADDR